MVFDRVVGGDKFPKKNFGLGRLRFHATSDLKVSPVLAPDHKLFLLTWYIYRGCLINFKSMLSMHFIINFQIRLVNFLDFLGFLLLTSEKSGGDTFLIWYFFSD